MAVNLKDRMNRIAPTTAKVHLGDIVYDLINAVNDLQTQNKALLAKLDTANLAGMGNTNAATLSPKQATVKLPEQR